MQASNASKQQVKRTDKARTQDEFDTDGYEDDAVSLLERIFCM